MKIAIVSDTHDNRALLRAAAIDAVRLGAEAILHCGDVVAPSTLSVVQDINVPFHVIHGNNTGDLVSLIHLSQREGNQIVYHGQDAGIELGGRRIFMVHYPHYARAMALTGDWDIVCCGHDHRHAVEEIENVRGGKTIYANPGSTGGVGAEPTWLMAELDNLTFELHTVPAATR